MMAVNEFKNLKAVAKYLQGKGWQVSERTVYNHGKRGLISPDKETGMFDIKAVERYATVYLKTKESKEKKQVSELQEKKVKGEIRLQEARAEREELKLLLEREQVVPRADLDMEFASRAGVLDERLTYFFNSQVEEIISLVGGDEKKAPDLVQYLLDEKDVMLNEFASMKEFYVLFEKNV